MIILVVILILSDLCICVYSHYTGATDEKFTVNSFMSYITDPNTINELILVFIFALVIVAVLHFVFKI